MRPVVESGLAGAGVLKPNAAVAAMGDPKVFKSGRGFAAWLGSFLGISAQVAEYRCSVSANGAIHTLVTC